MPSRSQIGVRIPRSWLRESSARRSETRRRVHASGRVRRPPSPTPKPASRGARCPTRSSNATAHDGHHDEPPEALQRAVRRDARPHVRRHGRGRRATTTSAASSSPAPAATSARAPTCGRWRATPATPTPRSTCRRAWPPTPTCVYKGLLRTYRPTKPLIAAVEGVAIAGGTEILQATDIRVAGETARFGVSEARWSLYPMGGSAVRLRAPDPLHASRPRSCSPASTSPPPRRRRSG